MDQAGKGKIVADVRQRFEKSNIAVVAHYRGLPVADMTDLRRQMRQAGGEIRVVKNTLARRAAQGTPFETVGSLLTGPTCIALSEDPVAPAKVMTEFSKNNPTLQVVGGVMDGNVVNLGEIAALAKLPSREVLLAQLMGVMMGPVRGFVTVLSAVPGGLVRVLEQIREEKAKQESA